MKHDPRITLAAAAALAIGIRAHAQSSTNAPAGAETMEKTLIEAVPLEESVIPTARPVNSVYGSDRSIIETPRNVTIISREQLDAIMIRDVRDFSKLTSSSYTRSNFGAPTTPDIRGQIADTFVNGMRQGLTSNGNGLPVNFNSVESVNIVKGPATAVYGASQYVGGYIDLITKRPYFDKFQGEVAATFGMYDQYRWTADFGGPISKKTAYRISYSGENSGSYYYDGFLKTQAAYLALTHIANENYEIAFNTEFFWANYTENFGINRPTQRLIDDKMYQTGVNNNPAPDSFGRYFDANGNLITVGDRNTPANINVPAGPAAPISDPQNSRWVTSGFPAINRMELGPEVAIDRRLRLLRPGDDSEGFSYQAQVIQTWHASDTHDLANNTYFRYIDRETQSSYYYSEIINPSYSIENRTELRGDLEPGDKMRWRYNTGAAVRYQFVEAYNDFFTEPAAVWDITRDRNYINIYNSATFPNSFTSVPVPGWENRYFTPDNGDSGRSEALQVGPFLQNDIKLWDRLSVIAGGRADILSVDYLMEWNNPDGFNRLADNTTVVLPSVNASIVWDWKQDLDRDLSTYFTYNWNQNPAGAIGNGGGITTQGGPGFSNGALRTEAELYEAGTKWGFLDGHAFLNLAAFAQNRINVNSQTRQQSEFQTMGFEFEANFQPNRNLYVTLGYSYLDSQVKYDSNGALFDVGNTTLTPPTDRFFILPQPGEIRRQGVPEHLFNLLVNYKFDCGFGMSANLVAHSDIWNNTVGTLVIPPQYTLDLSAYYIAKRWEARVFFLNVTDQWNWSAPNQVYGNESIVADLPFRVEGRVALKF